MINTNSLWIEKNARWNVKTWKSNLLFFRGISPMIKELFGSWNLKRTSAKSIVLLFVTVVLVDSKDNNNYESYKIIRVF